MPLGLAGAAEPARPAGPGRAEAGLVRPGAWPSPSTGTDLTEGLLSEPLTVDVESEGIIALGDGLEDDRLTLDWGQRVRIGVAQGALRLVRPYP